MTLRPELLAALHNRLVAADGKDSLDRVPIRVVVPELRAATVEDAERLRVRIAAWLGVFRDLEQACVVLGWDTDRQALSELVTAWVALGDRLDRAVPWERTRDLVKLARVVDTRDDCAAHTKKGV